MDLFILLNAHLHFTMRRDKDLPLTNETLSNKDEKENFTTLEHKPKDKDNKTYNFTLNP